MININEIKDGVLKGINVKDKEADWKAFEKLRAQAFKLITKKLAFAKSSGNPNVVGDLEQVEINARSYRQALSKLDPR